MRAPRAIAAASLALPLGSCAKVPLYDVAAAFSRADAAWFAEEETLFVFYEVEANQGIGEPSVIEVTWLTDGERVDWTPIDQLEPVHTHLPVDCGMNALCGSTSLAVALEPREVGIRLRYHRDGEMALEADTVTNIVGPGPAHSHRSLTLYGVFDARNERIQWRSRHQFPTLRNQQATDLGLRRDFRVEEATFGRAALAVPGNPYGYGARCPSGFADAGLDPIQTDERAIFTESAVPVSAGSATVVCAQGTVTDAKGSFTAGTVAQKNPEVRAAFPELQSPVSELVPVRFFLQPCDRVISPDHEEMQRQRLLADDARELCIDDWSGPGFADDLAARFSGAIERTRAEGRDMLLIVGLHGDRTGMSEVVEEAIAMVVPEERHRSSPRVAGAWVFDSETFAPELPGVSQSTLWCPADLPTGNSIPSASSLVCAVAPEDTEFELGPFSFGTLPILPGRTQYLDFIDTYSKRQAGEVLDLTFQAPEFATTTEHVDLGDFGVVTFLNGEFISAGREDALSYCTQDDVPDLFAFRSGALESEAFQALLAEACAEGGLPRDLCDSAALGALPLYLLPEWHETLQETRYDVGIFWQFPFLVTMEYELSSAGSVSALGLSIPFGFAQDGQSYLGAAMWEQDRFSLDEILDHCTRFCDHPTFDSAGVYHVLDPFRETYAQTCYAPAFPRPGDSGFPRDP